MRFLLKLVLAGVAVAALMPFVGPDTAAGKFVRAALDDAAGFCNRQPEACANGALIARDAGDLIATTIASLKADADTALSDADRAIEADQQIPPLGDSAREAFAGHNGAIHY